MRTSAVIICNTSRLRIEPPLVADITASRIGNLANETVGWIIIKLVLLTVRQSDSGDAATNWAPRRQARRASIRCFPNFLDRVNTNVGSGITASRQRIRIRYTGDTHGRYRTAASLEREYGATRGVRDGEW